MKKGKTFREYKEGELLLSAEKQKFTGFEGQTLFTSRSQVQVELCFSKGPTVPIITLMKCGSEELTLFFPHVQLMVSLLEAAGMGTGAAALLLGQML